MAKIMLVEDDNNLREIYGARLLAEGHEIVAAKDGEEALALAVQEKPDLIISDVMMPRISGFDMLDILRNAPETKYTKVIMMTALSQAEDKSRADKLGADRYLVKSQVTLEDVANVVREVLEGDDAATGLPAAATAPAPASEPAPSPTPAAESVATPTSVAAPAPEPQPIAAPIAPQSALEPIPAPTIPEITEAPVAATPDPVPTVAAIADPVVDVPDDADNGQVQAPPTTVATDTTPVAPAAPVAPPVSQPIQVVAPAVPPAPEPVMPTPLTSVPTSNEPAVPTVVNGTPTSTVVAPTQPTTTPLEDTPVVTEPAGNEVNGKKIIQPISNPDAKPSLDQLLAAEEQKAAVQNPTATTVITPQTSSDNNSLNNIAL